MKLPWILCVVLALLLLITNTAWFYAALDQGVARAHRDQSFREHCHALKTCMATMPLVTTANREQVLAAARGVVPENDEFEKEGAVWLGSIGLRFVNDRLVAVLPAWEPFECPDWGSPSVE